MLYPPELLEPVAAGQGKVQPGRRPAPWSRAKKIPVHLCRCKHFLPAPAPADEPAGGRVHGPVRASNRLAVGKDGLTAEGTVMETEIDDAVAADAHARWHHGLLADQGDARVEVRGEFLVGHIQAVAVTDAGAGADVHPFVEDGQVDHRVLLDDRIGEDHRVGNRGPFFDVHARREYRVDHRALDDAARGDHGRGHLATVQKSRRGAVHRPVAVVGIGADLPFLR